MLHLLKFLTLASMLIPAFQGGALTAATSEPGDVKVRWIHGSPNCTQDKNPPLQIHSYNENTVILRQNKCLNYEAPFLYLFFGREKALLVDTGATRSPQLFPLRATVEDLLTQHYGAEERSRITLIVAHSHAHGDHAAGDTQFANQPYTILLGKDVAALTRFFGIATWPLTTGSLDLGNRKLEIIPLPGHEKSHIAIYDTKSAILLTGDALYPGRLYIEDWTAYRASISRLVNFVATRDITYIFGAHIEMSDTPGIDYPIGSTYQPAEHRFDMSRETLIQLQKRLDQIGPVPTQDVQSDFIIYPT